MILIVGVFILKIKIRPRFVGGGLIILNEDVTVALFVIQDRFTRQRWAFDCTNLTLENLIAMFREMRSRFQFAKKRFIEFRIRIVGDKADDTLLTMSSVLDGDIQQTNLEHQTKRHCWDKSLELIKRGWI